ncbi:MAG: hypothetical protein ABJG15_02145 [Hyphomonadaceae bacterium]
MSNANGYNDGGRRRWSILLIFLLLVGFGAVAVWFWMNQETASNAIETVEVSHPSLEAIPAPTQLTREPVSDEQAVEDGTLSRFNNELWLESRTFIGTDKNGRTANLRIYILSQDYAWAFGAGNDIVKDGQSVPIASMFSGDDFQERFCASDNLMAIGTSSFEGPQELNHRLARTRGQALVASLTNLKASCDTAGPSLLAASLGEHAETSPCPGRVRCPEATQSQRRILLVGVNGSEDGINYDEALWSGMRRFDAGEDGFFRDFRLADYDQFEVLN